MNKLERTTNLLLFCVRVSALEILPSIMLKFLLHLEGKSNVFNVFF